MDEALGQAAPRPAKVRLGALFDIAIWALFVWAPGLGLALLGVHAGRGPLLLPLLTLGWMVLLTLVTTGLLARRGETWREVAFRGRLTIGRTIVLVVGGYLAFYAVDVLVYLLVYALHLGQPTLKLFAPIRHQPWVFALWLVVALCSASLGEELQFRGFLLSRLERLFGQGKIATILAVIAQGVVFGLGHGYQGMAGVLLIGAWGFLFAGVFLLARRNLIPGMLIHAVADTLALTVIFLS